VDSDRSRLVAGALAEWRAQLIDVGATNRLLYYRELKVGTLDLADADGVGIEQLRRLQPVRLGRLFSDSERLAAAQKSVRQIAAKARAAAEEFGVPISYLAVGMATWDDDRTPLASGRAVAPNGATEVAPPTRQASRPSSPVLLQPIGFEARPGTRDGFQLEAIGEPLVNPVLLHVLQNSFDVGIDEAELLEAAGDDEMVFDLLTKACKEVGGFAVSERMLIGTFSYLKQPMVDDLQDSQLGFLADNDMVAAIAGVTEARDSVRAQGGDVSEAGPDYEPPVNEFLVLDADASQSFVINAASGGQNLVVQGPPGTGKSQTIANLIADLVAHDKSVLFVAQKRAAITAVLSRLERVGLGGFVLDMFAGAGSRKTVVSTIGMAIESMATARSPLTESLHARLADARDRLTEHQVALHELREPWGTSVWALMALKIGSAPSGSSRVRIPIETMRNWTNSTVDELAGVAAELAASGGFDAGLNTRPGWGIDAFSTLEEANSAHRLAQHVRTLELPRVEHAIAAIVGEVGVRAPTVVPELPDFKTLAQQTTATWTAAPAALDPSLGDETLAAAYGAVASKAWRGKYEVKMTWSERRAGRKIAGTLIQDRVDHEHQHALLLTAANVRAKWRSLGAPHPPTVPQADSEEVADAVDRLLERLGALQASVQGLDLASMPLSELGSTLDALIADPDRLRLPHIHELRKILVGAGLGNVLQEASVGVDVATADARVRFLFAASLLDHIISTDSRLAGVQRSQLERWAREFLSADMQHLQVNADRVRRIAAERMAASLNAHPDEHSAISRQVRRKRGFSSVRQLFRDAPNVLTAIKPCWAMSPLMVSQMVPAARLFDVVIFDEASQVMPADAIPAIARGSQVVVAGDRHQLPPTDFFVRLSDVRTSDDEEEDEGADVDEELTTAIPETRDVESILDTLDVVLSGRSRTLSWHYRSKDERLIATSNAYVYHRRLITFPSANGEERIIFEPVAPSPGLGRNNKSPSGEVTKVVELALEHARIRPNESLGIIAFGSDHAKRIEATLDARLRDEEELQEFFQQSGDEPFFIKNIERVQGDEREAIILTVGYGMSDDGRMRYMWGPLLAQGGERRLNVAISRAKSRMTLVASFTPDDVDPTANSSRGFELMYRFIEFMASGGETFGDDPGREVELNPFEEDVMRRLVDAGLELEPQWGVGNYKIDFAIRDPEHRGRFILAVECDGAMYHSGIVARERDRLRQQHLERLGWRFHRIWSTDWFQDPQPQVDAVLTAVAAACEARDRQPAPPGGYVDLVLQGEYNLDPAKLAALARQRVRERGPRPRVMQGLPITQYARPDLVKLIRWIMSDDVIRTDEALLTAVMDDLGFAKRGSRIVAAIMEAIQFFRRT
jgi:very-short-patch-repair endonuclease